MKERKNVREGSGAGEKEEEQGGKDEGELKGVNDREGDKGMVKRE